MVGFRLKRAADNSDKGHLCIKDTFRYTNLYSGNTFYL